MVGGNTLQQKCFDDIMKYAKQLKTEASPEIEVFSLIGSAGTGKTWLMAELIRAMKAEKIQVALTTPTHQALEVAVDMLKKNKIEEDVITGTIHYFLNLKLDYGFGDDGNADNVTTKPKLVLNKFNECLQYTDILFIDESSMISEELYKLTMEILGDRARMIIFVGDQYQLKPVEGGENIIYDHPDVRHLELIETVRQKEGSSIIAKANEIRDYIKYGNHPETVYNLFEETSEISLIQEAEFLPVYFADEKKRKVGSYTNAMVDQYNAYIRYIETNELEYLCDQDTVVFQKPYTDSKGLPIFQNGESVKIESTKLAEDLKFGTSYWRCKSESGRMFNVLDPNSKTQYATKLKELLDQAKKAKGYDRSKAWKAYFKLQTRYGIIKYSFASTLHKLQGSTTQHMYFDMRDLGKFYRFDPDNVLRLIYVAITRPEEKVYILE